ncbi:MAG TPA: CpaF family protein [Candidatus Dormibacteraeota bacterium]
MRVAVHFSDGEVIDGSSEAMSLSKMGFPLVPDDGNNELVWVSLSSIKYVLVFAGNMETGEHNDPRETRGLPKVVIRFHDGEVLRTYRDENWGQEAEGFALRIWDRSRHRLVRALVSLHSVKGIFFVKEWDSRTSEERLEQTRKRVATSPATPMPAPGPAAAEGVEEKILPLAQTYRRRLAQVRDKRLATGTPTEFVEAVRDHLPRLVREDRIDLSADEARRLTDEILRNAFGYGPLDPLLLDRSVTEILVNGAENIYVERQGQLHRTDYRFENEAQLLEVIRKMAASVGRRVDEATPMVDARLLDGSRLNAIIPPAAVDGPMLTVRKFPHVLNSLVDLVNERTLGRGMAYFLEAAVLGRANLLISGGTGSGKTTTLNVLGSLVPQNQRLVTIEDTAELQLAHPHVVRLEYRPPSVEGRGELTIRRLLRNSLRMRPDRIIVGEARGQEALDMLQAMNTGHDGSMSTIHANSARDAVSRLETMVLSAAIDLPLDAVRAQILAAVDLLVHQVRRPDGARIMTQISELVGFDADGPVLRDVFEYTSDGAAGAAFRPTGFVPRCLKKLDFYGVSVGSALFSADAPKGVEEAAAQAAAV